MNKPLPIVLVSCAATKQKATVPAAELYTSALFRKSLAHARRLTSEQRIRILSAKYGAIATTTPIEPYDLSIYDLTPAERAAWSTRVRLALLEDFARDVAGGAELVIFAGAEYVRALGAPLPWPTLLPFGARPIGLRLRWLNEQAALASGAASLELEAAS